MKKNKEMLKKMKNKINSIISVFGVQLIRAKKGQTFDMEAALWRAGNHGIKINTVIDIGALGGKWSLVAMQYFPRAIFLAFEPLKEKKRALEKLKQKYNNFHFELVAAGNEDKQSVFLNVTDDLDGSTVDGKNPGTKRRIPVRTVDSVVSEKKLNGPFLLKFDTHGYEMPILEGCTEVIKETNLIIMETYNFNITDHSIRFHEMCTHMENLGFRCYDIAGPSLRSYDNSFWQIDLFFIPKNSQLFNYPHSK